MNQLGYYGKTPHKGDFVRFNLPQSFVNVWDDWLQHLLVYGEQAHDDWPERYQHASGYRFVLSSGIAGNDVWIGLLQPSQDKVGRRFPFCLAMSLSEASLPCVCATAHTVWFENAEALMARVQSSEYNFDDLQKELGELAQYTEQIKPAIANQLTRVENNAADSITVSIASDNALQHPLITPALLDTVLTQSVGEYSLWINANPNSAATIVASGLPSENAGISLFTNDWQSGSTVQLEISALALSEGSALSLFTAADIDNVVTENNPTQPLTSTSQAGSSELQNNPLGTNNTDDPTSDSAASLAEQTEKSNQLINAPPSADDWAALDEFDDSSHVTHAVITPKVEPLELDEEDLPEAPWE